MGENYKCDICGAPATVHLTQIVDGKIHKVHLCEKCAAKSKVAELPILKFTEMLAKTLASGGKKASEEMGSRETVGRTPEKICPRCGMTDVLFAQKNLFGCPFCYEVFSEKIEELFPKIQKGKTYRGDIGKTAKKPRGNNEKSVKDASLDDLRKRLNAAVASEDYALAARLRDELRAAEKIAARRVPVVEKSSKKSEKTTPEKAGKSSVPAKKARGVHRSRGKNEGEPLA